MGTRRGTGTKVGTGTGVGTVTGARSGVVTARSVKLNQFVSVPSVPVVNYEVGNYNRCKI